MPLRSCRGIQEDRSPQICRKWQNEHEFAKNELVLPILIDFELIFQVFVLNNQHKVSFADQPLSDTVICPSRTSTTMVESRWT